jgi:hypothetical protein
VLSEFYLDTELGLDDFIRIKKVFDSSGLSLDEIRKIDLFEVFPLLQTNLLAPAGAWAGFDEPWLTIECTKRYKRRRFLLYRLACKFWNRLFYWMRKRYWLEIENLSQSIQLDE